MNLKKLKETFQTLSGRYDLVHDDATDIVRTFFNAAARRLDRKVENQKSYGSHFAEIAVDGYVVNIPYCRAIKEVWVSTTTGKWQLEKRPIQDLIDDYLGGDTVSSGTPLYYAPVITREIPKGADLSSFSGYLNYLDVQADLNDLFNAIIVMGPTDTKLVADVRGYYYAKELVEDSDENYWSVLYPLTLVKAALRELELFNQNKTKADEWTKAVADDLLGIELNLIEEDISGIDQMEN